MQRFLPENLKEKEVLAMGAIFLEEHGLLDALGEVLKPDLLEWANLEEADQELVRENADEYFLRLDLNYDPELRADILDVLAEMWNVADRTSALTMINNLIKQGHRYKFDQLKANTHSLPNFKEIFKFDFSDADDVQLSDDDYLKLAAWIKRASSFVSDVGILAWDCARCVHLIRLSFFVGYLSDQEAWEQVHRLGDAFGGQFKNWNQFAQSFLIGCTFWSGSEDAELKKACERLMGYSFSPWRLYPLLQK